MVQGCKNQSITVLFVSVVLCAGLIAGCSSPRVQPSPEQTLLGNNDPDLAIPNAPQSIPDPDPDVTLGLPLSEPVEDSESAYNPLTGRLVENPDRLNIRPILIKVTLYPRNNRPQWGLSQADIVYEHYTEGGLSRFSALYYGKEAEIVGPIRSARFVDIQLVRMYGAIFAYGSADGRVLEQIDSAEFAERALREFPAGCPPLCRLDPTGQNHLITDTRSLQAFYADLGVDLNAPNLSGMAFDELTPGAAQPGTGVAVTYSDDNFHTWEFEPETGRYLRSQETGAGQGQVAPLEDRTTGSRIGADNVVVLSVPHALYARTPEIIDIQLYGEGEGTAFRDGGAYEIRWIRPFPEGVLYLTFPDGNLYPLKPGTTWFELVGATSQISLDPEGSWRVDFDTP